MIKSIDRVDLQIGLVVIWALAAIAGMFLLNIWAGLGFASALAYVMLRIWSAVLKAYVTHRLIRRK